MVSVKMPSHLVSNRLLQEGYEDRQYKAHLKKVYSNMIITTTWATLKKKYFNKKISFN